MTYLVEEFVRETEEAIAKVTRSLVSGGAKSHEEYKQKCGEIRAYERSIDNMLNIYMRVASEDKIEEIK